jgi:tRNA dimethylallyltransferase
MEVILCTGRSFSDQRIQHPPPHRVLTIGLTRPREELYHRVDERIDAMFSSGLLEEVRSLLDQGYQPDLPTFSAIGYREAAAILQSEMSIEEAKASMRRQTRAFVRRQANWFKTGDPSISWFEVGRADTVDRISNYIGAWLVEAEQ